MKKITRVDQSPLNPQRWCCELECGHEVWLTMNQRPRSTSLHCATCDNEANPNPPRRSRGGG